MARFGSIDTGHVDEQWREVSTMPDTLAADRQAGYTAHLHISRYPLTQRCCRAKRAQVRRELVRRNNPTYPAESIEGPRRPVLGRRCVAGLAC